MVPTQGFEPRHADSESAILPLDDVGMAAPTRVALAKSGLTSRCLHSLASALYVNLWQAARVLPSAARTWKPRRSLDRGLYGRGEGSRTHTSTLGKWLAAATTRPDLDLWKRRRRSFLAPSFEADRVGEVTDRIRTVDDLGDQPVFADLYFLWIYRDDLAAHRTRNEDPMPSGAPEIPSPRLKCLVFGKLHHRAPKTIFKMSFSTNLWRSPRSNAAIVSEKHVPFYF